MRTEGEGEKSEGSSEHVRTTLGECNPKCCLYTSPGQDRCGLLFGLGIGQLFMEAGFEMSASGNRGFWRWLPALISPASINLFYEAAKSTRLGK